MTQNQQFTVALFTLILSGVVTPLIAIMSMVISKRNAENIAAVKSVVEPMAQKLELVNGAVMDGAKAVDGRLTQLMEEVRLKERAEGKVEGMDIQRAISATVAANVLTASEKAASHVPLLPPDIPTVRVQEPVKVQVIENPITQQGGTEN